MVNGWKLLVKIENESVASQKAHKSRAKMIKWLR